MNEISQFIRNIARPVMTWLLVSTLCILCLIAMYAVCIREVDIDKILKVIGIIDAPVAMIMTYHFVKSSKVDEK